MQNNLVRSISEDGSAISIAVDSTEIVRAMRGYHNTSATASAALGRLLTAAALMGAMLKSEGNTVTLRIDADGPIGKMIAVTDEKSQVRGYCQNPSADAELKRAGKLDVSGVVGKNGTLTVITDLGLKEPYIGQVPLVSGEIAEDITQYYATSQQTPTACALGVLVDTDLSILSAGGYIIQLLPGTEDSVIDKIEHNLQVLPPISTMLKNGMSAEEISLKVLDGLNPTTLDHSTASYKCTCSRDRMRGVLASLPKDELKELAAEGDAEIICEFCHKKYVFTPEELLEL